MIIYVVIELIEYPEDDPTCRIVFSSENKEACINYCKFIEKIEKENEEYWDYSYFVDKIYL